MRATTIGKLLPIFGSTLQIGCVAAPAVAMVVVGGAIAANIVAFTNLARDQYPDIAFEEPAPIEITYKDSLDKTWNNVVDVLFELGERSAVMSKDGGYIRTEKKNLNDINWVEKAFAKASFKYEMNITVRESPKGTRVKLEVPFWEEKTLVVVTSGKQKNIPEGSNLIRHIFFHELNEVGNPKLMRLPDNPDQDIQYVPITKQPEESVDVNDDDV